MAELLKDKPLVYRLLYLYTNENEEVVIVKIMNRKTFCILFLSSLLIIPSICIAGEPVAERPSYSEGDFWLFVTPHGQESKIEFLREEKDTYVFSTNGAEFITDFNLTNVNKNKHIGYPGPVIEFPLAVGKKWDYKFEIRKKKKKGSKIIHYNVEAYESITVRAGTFQAYKIVARIESLGPGKMTHSVQYWYAPEVKQVIKSYGKEFSELKDYKIK